MAKTDNLKDLLTDVADAIREKKNTTALINPQDFSTEILAIETGGGGATRPSAEINDVNFYDYDGHILYSYTWGEALALTTLPPAPSHADEGLVFQEWNYTLDDIKAQSGLCDVGAIYDTDDGKTHLHIVIVDSSVGYTELLIQQTASNGALIEWGDGESSSVEGTDKVTASHTYVESGEYVVKISAVNGTVQLGHSVNNAPLMGADNANKAKLRKVYASAVQPSSFAFTQTRGLIAFSSNSANIAFQLFYYANALRHINTAKQIGRTTNYGVGYYAPGLVSVSIGPIITASSEIALQNAFNNAVSLQRVVVPEGVTQLLSNVFSYTNSLTLLKMPSTLKDIGSGAVNTMPALRVWDFTSCDQVPNLAATITALPTTCEIRVPMALVDEWKAATNWSTYADQIVGY